MVEPTIQQTIEILKGLKSRFEEHHGVKYTSSAIAAAAELSAKFINDRHLPDKAIDVIDEAGAAQRILPKSRQKKTIGKTEVEEIIAKIARIPPQTVSSDDRAQLKNLDRNLKNVVFGQDPAIEALSAAIKMGARGWVSPISRSARSCSRPNRSRQDRGCEAAGVHVGHRADSVRHVGIYGASRR